MRRFIEEAHDRGIAVIVDLVMNHTSIEHPWFQDALTGGSQHEDWYVWADESPGYAGPDGQPVWHAAGDRYYYGLFWEGMPDLNLENPDVEAELDAVARYWLDDIGVDGFRLDAIKHFVEEGQAQEDTDASHAWLAGFHDRVRTVNPDTLLVGEVFDASIVSSSYVPEAVDLTFDFELAGKMLNSVRAGHGETVSAGQAKALERYPGGQYGAFLTNHDQNRVGTTLRGDAAMHVAATLLLTNPGIPFVYYGEEIGLPGAKPDERIRTPMPWDGGGAGGFTTGTPWEPLEEGWETRNVAAQSADDGSLLSHYRALIHLRGDLPALRTGSWQAFQSDATGVYAFLVRGEDESAAVVVNVGDEAAADYALVIDAAATCGTGAAALAYADGYATPPEPAGFDDPGYGSDAVTWQPAPELPAHSTLVVRLSP
jgi:glycosidase